VEHRGPDRAASHNPHVTGRAVNHGEGREGIPSPLLSLGREREVIPSPQICLSCVIFLSCVINIMAPAPIAPNCSLGEYRKFVVELYTYNYYIYIYIYIFQNCEPTTEEYLLPDHHWAECYRFSPFPQPRWPPGSIRPNGTRTTLARVGEPIHLHSLHSSYVRWRTSTHYQCVADTTLPVLVSSSSHHAPFRHTGIHGRPIIIIFA